MNRFLAGLGIGYAAGVLLAPVCKAQLECKAGESSPLADSAPPKETKEQRLQSTRGQGGEDISTRFSRP